MVLQQEDEVLQELKMLDEDLFGNLTNEEEILSQIDVKNKVLNILHLNIRSVKKNFDHLLLLIQRFKLSFCDLIILSECFQLISIDQFNIPGYTTFYNNGNYNKNDGVLILINSSIIVEMSHIKLSKSETTISRITFKHHNVTYGITATYKPPPINELLFTEDIDNYFNNKLNKDIEIFIGDININIINENNNVNEYLSTMGRHGFIPYIGSPTRVTVDTASCIDHIFVRKKLKTNNLKFKSFILDTHITDHYPIMLNIKYEKQQQTTTHSDSNFQRTYTKFDYLTFKQNIKSQIWCDVLNSNNPETATNTFVKIFTDLMELSKTSHTVKSKGHKKIKKWITNGIITSIIYRDNLKKKLLKNYDPELESEYKTYRNKLNKLIFQAKNNYYKTQIESCKNNVKKIYKIITEATNEKNSPSSVELRITDDNEKDFDNKSDMANYCNNYFINAGIDMEKKINVPQNPYKLEQTTLSSMFLRPATEKEIIKHIATLKNNSASGEDGISAKLIKLVHLDILTPLTHIINLIFRTGIVPSHFKTTIVTPIFKAGSKNDIKNYRPISLINNFAKIFEKCFKERLIQFFSENNILAKNQFGFKEGFSTCDAMYHLTSEVTNNLNIGKKCIAVFIDLAKAFDTVPHDKLLNVLSHYGVRGTVLNVLESYLLNRHQCVKINNTTSDPQVIKIGVPQGTVLGPILFITYINSLLKLKIRGKLISYADDTALVFSGKTWEETKYKTIEAIDIVKNWLDSFKLSLNIKKTNYIAFSLTNANRPDFVSINIANDKQSINEVSEVKYLGIILDKHLKWNPHIEHLTKKIRKLINKFYLLREFLNKKLLISIYKALIESLIRYGIIIWGGLYKSALNQLNVIQNYILKIIGKKKKLFPTNLLYNEEICNVRTLYIIAICSYIHKHEELKQYVSHNHDTRNKINRHLIIPVNHTNINLRFLNYLAPKIYNLLPCHLKTLNNRKLFNKKCRTYVTSNYHKFINIM